jgi:hypothetical protein
VTRSKNVARFSRYIVLIVVGSFLAGCHVVGDEREWLGERIGKAADQLRRSAKTELVISYASESGVNQRYSVGVGKSVWCPTPPCNENQSALTVSVERGRQGSTTYHMRFVAVPAPLQIQKNGAATEVVLRKVGDIIELVELR